MCGYSHCTGTLLTLIVSGSHLRTRPISIYHDHRLLYAYMPISLNDRLSLLLNFIDLMFL